MKRGQGKGKAEITLASFKLNIKTEPPWDAGTCPHNSCINLAKMMEPTLYEIINCIYDKFHRRDLSYLVLVLFLIAISFSISLSSLYYATIIATLLSLVLVYSTAPIYYPASLLNNLSLITNTNFPTPIRLGFSLTSSSSHSVGCNVVLISNVPNILINPPNSPITDHSSWHTTCSLSCDVQAKPQASTTTIPPSSASSSASSITAFFATPPASLDVPADFIAAPFFATDFLKAFFPGLEATQTSVEPQPLITDPLVSDLIHIYSILCCRPGTYKENSLLLLYIETAAEV